MKNSLSKGNLLRIPTTSYKFFEKLTLCKCSSYNMETLVFSDDKLLIPTIDKWSNLVSSLIKKSENTKFLFLKSLP